MKYNLAICLPGIRIENWEKLYDSAIESVRPYLFEMIIVGPNFPSPNLLSKQNFKFIQDYGSPARCAQIATTQTNSEYIVWGSDDGLFTPNSLGECLNMFYNHNNYNIDPNKDEIIIKYSEGSMSSGGSKNEYYNARHHNDLKLPGVKEKFKIAPVGMLKLDYFRWLGGLDCRYEHLNMNAIDLSFRIQNNGGNLHLSPNVVMNCSWEPNTSGIHAPVHYAHLENDLPLFREMWGKENNTVRIDYDNWKNSPEKWPRRFEFN